MPRNDPYQHVGFRLPPKLVEALDRAAALTGSTRTEIAVSWLEESARRAGFPVEKSA